MSREISYGVIIVLYHLEIITYLEWWDAFKTIRESDE